MTDMWLDMYAASEDWFLYGRFALIAGDARGYTGKGLTDVLNRAFQVIDAKPDIYPLRLEITKVPEPTSLALFNYETIIIL